MKFKTLTSLALFAGLVACQPSIPEATDQQIVDLVGGPSSASGAKIIQKSAVECLRLISGLDDQIYKDAPPELIATLKTECRKELNERLSDQSRNPLGFKLEHFENQNLVARVESIWAHQQKEIEIKREEAEKARLEQQQQREMARKKEKADDLANAKSEATQHLAYVENWLVEMQGKCSKLEELKQQRRKSGVSLPIPLTAKLLRVCQDHTFSGVQKEALKTSEKIQDLTYDPNVDSARIIPSFQASSKTKLEKYRLETDEATFELETILAEKSKKS